MTNEELAYIAGFFDGEGSITIHENAGKSPRGIAPNHIMQVSIGNTDPAVLRWLHANFGGTYCVRRKVSERHRVCHQWIIRAREALRFLLAIRPFLRMKGPQADVAIGFQHSKKMQGPKAVLPEVIAWREKQRIEIRRLNGRNLH